MKPLVEELDESAGQQIEGSGTFGKFSDLPTLIPCVLIYFGLIRPGPVNVPGLDLLTLIPTVLSAGERSRIDLGPSDEVTVPSYQESPPADLDQGRSQGTKVRHGSCDGLNHDGLFTSDRCLFQVGSHSTS